MYDDDDQMDLIPLPRPPRCDVCGEDVADHREPGWVELGVDVVSCEAMAAARNAFRPARITEADGRGLSTADLEDWT